MGAMTNNRFRPTPSPNDPAVAPIVIDSNGDSVPVKILDTVPEEETNGHIPAGTASNNARTQSRTRNFSFKQVRRNITKQLSLDDFDWDAAKQRNEQIEQIALNDQDLYTMPESKLEKAWLGFLNTLSDTFLVARLTIRLMSYLGVGECKCLLSSLQQHLYRGTSPLNHVNPNVQAAPGSSRLCAYACTQCS